MKNNYVFETFLLIQGNNIIKLEICSKMAEIK